MSTVRTAGLPWGHRYLMVEPNHFRVDYAINPFMHLDDQPDPAPHPRSSGWRSSRRSRPPVAASRCSRSCPRPPTWSTR